MIHSLNELSGTRSVLLLDGAMGTELERRGYRTTLPTWTALANTEAPDLVSEIHRDYIDAGADIITSNTFRTTSYTLDKVSQSHLAKHLTLRAVALAREATSKSPGKIAVAGSIAPLEDCYRPDLLPSRPVMESALTDQLDILMDADIDFILAETMINKAEAMYIARYLHEVRFPFMVSFTVDEAPALLDGTPLDRIIRDIAEYAPLAILINCTSADIISTALPVLQRTFDGMTGAYGHGPGRPDPNTGWKSGAAANSDYSAFAVSWVRKGARIVGGCCGTTPAMIKAIFTRLSETASL